MDQTAKANLFRFLAKYKSFLLILLAGVLLMLLGTGGKEEAQTQPIQPQTQEESLQEQLSRLLSQLQGAGEVQVLLTQATGAETAYQEDTQAQRTDTVILTDGSRSQTGLIRRVDPPTYLGAVVLCQGAEDSGVRLAITQAVANATSLGYHKITVLKMK